MAETPVPHDPRELPRVLGLWDGLAISVGVIIGSGIFMTGPGVCAQFTSVTPVILLWIGGAILSLLGGLTYAEISSAYPRTGGDYAYLLEGYGRPVAFIYGWNQLILGPAGLGALCVGFATFFLTFYQLPWDPAIVAAGLAVFLTAVNILGTTHSSLVMKIFTALKVLALVLLIGAGLVFGRWNSDGFRGLGEFAAREGGLSGALALAIFPIIWTYAGWNSITQVAGEVSQPQKRLPAIILGSIAAVTAIYLLANLLYIGALGVQSVGTSTNVAGDTARVFLGETFASVITFAVICSIFGATNGGVLTGARINFAMARSGLTFEFLGYKHPRLQTPAAALIWNGVGAVAYTLLFPSFFQLLGYSMFASVLFMGLSGSTIFLFRERGVPSAFRTPGYPWVPLAFVLINVAVILNASANTPMESSMILGALLLGFPIYSVWRKLTRPERRPLQVPTAS
jgi:APA family basic amino acid/polyamine antiporter